MFRHPALGSLGGQGFPLWTFLGELQVNSSLPACLLFFLTLLQPPPLPKALERRYCPAPGCL